MPHAIALLQADPAHVKDLFRQYEAAGHRAHRKTQGIAEGVFAALAVPTTLEEDLFSPAMKRKADHDGNDLVAEAVEAHHVVTTLMEEVKGLDPTDERYDATFTVLMEHVAHPIEEEEGELFPEADAVVGERLERLGAQRQERQPQLTAPLM